MSNIVLEANRIGTGHKAFCYNKPRTRQEIKVRDGYTDDGQIKWVTIQDFGSVDCKYDLAIAPEHCSGCRHINPALVANKAA